MHPITRAFTLIELLIVVAIIAILAAIAVPNFLEAQVRSKVARVKADQRSTATALESYRVDNNSYPPDFTDVLRGFPQYNMLIMRHHHMTTPIAYITNVTEDIFAGFVAAGNAVRPNGSPQSGAPYRQGGVASGAIIRPLPYDYAKFDRTGTNQDSLTVWAEITASPESVEWALNSAGPRAQVFEYLGFLGLTIYDATNGTISNGQIIRTNLSSEDKPKNL